MTAIALSTLRATVRMRAKMENSTFVTDAEVNAIINAEGGELFDLLISRPTNPFTTNTTLTIASGNTVAIPAGFFAFRALDFQHGAEWVEVQRSTFAQRNRTAGHGRARERYFDMIGGLIYVTPAESAVGTYRLWYDPQWTPLVLDVDVINLPNGWEEYIVCGAAAQLLALEESDPSFWETRKAKAQERILVATTERDKGAPRAIVDVRRRWSEDDCDEDYP